MLTFWGPKYCVCDRISRRGFLRVGALGLGGLTLADLLRHKARGAVRPKSSVKSIIMVYLHGGPSHIDMFDMKPDALVRKSLQKGACCIQDDNNDNDCHGSPTASTDFAGERGGFSGRQRSRHRCVRKMPVGCHSHQLCQCHGGWRLVPMLPL